VEPTVFKTKAKSYLSSLAVAVILLVALLWGAAKGKTTAQSEAIVKAQANLVSGLKFFYQDQNRFPSATEFADSPTMLSYFTVFPPPNFVSKNCSQSFFYVRNNLNNYTLSFCLPVASGGYVAGWNSINNDQN
jgi:hypothetical protein